MGFGAATAAAGKPKLGLLAVLPGIDKKLATQAITAGVDALIVPASLAGNTESVGTLLGDLAGALWGLELADGVVPEGDLGFDFVLVSGSSALVALKGEDKGRLLRIDPGWGDVQLRVLDQLSIDGAVFPLAVGWGEALRIEHFLAVRRLSLLMRKPLLVELNVPLASDELALLRDAGLAGILVTGEAAKRVETLEELKNAIEVLPPKGKPRREVEVTLPSMTAGSLEAEEEEEEEP